MRKLQWSTLFEVLAVTMLGLGASLLLPGLLGTTFDNPLVSLRPDALPANWLPLARDMLEVLLVQYAGQLLLAALFLAWLDRLRPARVGLTRNGWTVSQLFAVALLLAGLTFPLVRGLVQAGQSLGWSGTAPPWRQALLEAPLTWDFMVFMAVLSFIVVPILEELFYRGYMQTRLQRVLSPMAAVAITSAIFTLLHAQYLGLGWFNLASIASLLVFAFALGALYQYTGSLWPSMLLHALINVPLPEAVVWALVVGGPVALAVLHRPLLSLFRGLRRSLMEQSPSGTELLLLLVGTGYALIIAWHLPTALLLALAFLVAALVLRLLGRRSAT